MLTADQLRLALTQHRGAPDPADVELPVPVEKLPAGWQEENLASIRVAAILVPFVDRGAGLEVLLTERAAHLKHHPGQISFPGGAAEPGDDGLAMTALRETEEEVGVPMDRVEVLGYLRPQWTISGYSMTPVIGLINGDVDLRPDPAEVADSFLVPASHLFDSRQHRREQRIYEGLEFDVMEISWQRHRIWGATAGVVDRLYNIIKNSK